MNSLKLKESLHGVGSLCVRGCEPSPVYYSISYWGAAGDRELTGVGHVSSTITVMQAAGRGEPAVLRLADGRRVEVDLKHRGAGTDWEYVEVTGPAAEGAGAKVYSLECERARMSMELCTGLAAEAETPEDAAAWLDLAEAWAQLLEVARFWAHPSGRHH